MAKKTKHRKNRRFLIIFISSVVVLVAAMVVVIKVLPTAPYYLKYHTTLYKGADNSAAEFAQNIPYDKYIGKMSIEDVKSFSALTAVYHSSDYNKEDINPLQTAVDYAAKNGGGIVIADKDMTIERLELKSKICLFIPKDITVTVTGYRTDNNEFRFIEANGAKNIIITGGGKLRGTGEAYWNEANLVTITKPLKVYDIEILKYLHFQQKRTRKEDISTKFILFNLCNNINISNLIIENSPGWNLSVEASKNVHINNLVLNSNYHGPNTDGIDISATSNVLIEHCYLSVGDDAICLKNDKYYNDKDDLDMSNIEARDCFIRSATNGFKIGTGVYNNISNVRVSNLTMDVEGIYPPTICGITILVSEGGKLSDVHVDKVTMNNVLAPVFIRLNNRNNFKDQSMTGVMKNISVTNIKASNTEMPIIISGVKDKGKVSYIDGVKLENIFVTYRDSEQSDKVNSVTDKDVDESAHDYPEAWMMGDVPAYGIYFHHIRNVSTINCTFIPRKADTRKEIYYSDAR